MYFLHAHKKCYQFEMHALQAKRTAPPSAITITGKKKIKKYKQKEIEFKIGIIQTGSSIQNIQCDLFSSQTIDLKQMEKLVDCITIYLHVSIWTWCTFTMWDLFEIENLIWNRTFCWDFFFICIWADGIENDCKTIFRIEVKFKFVCFWSLSRHDQ